MKIKLQKGSAVIKEFCPHKIKKEMNKILFKDAVMSGENISGIKMDSMEEANSYVMLSMVEKIEINGADKPVEVSTFDEMDERDYKVILEAINEVIGTKENLPKN